MKGYTKTIVVGRIGNDPELKCNSRGMKYCKLKVSHMILDNNKQEAVKWYNIMAVGRSAELVVKYMTKGNLICIEGAYAKENETILAEHITFLSPAKKQEPVPDADTATATQTATIATN